MSEMSRQRNDHVLSLLAWHSHNDGGVRVPFVKGGAPLGYTLKTRLLTKLNEAAKQLASGQEAPRWYFLVGGPGNGKSQMMEEFIKELDQRLSCNGELSRVVQEELERSPIPRKLVIGNASAYRVRLPRSFFEKIGQLVLVQDASASDEADKDAAQQLAADLEVLLDQAHESRTVFACCVNRGLLARTLRLSSEPRAVKLLEAIIMACGLGEGTITQHRTACWPLSLPQELSDLNDMVACWPLDMESLLLEGTEAAPSAVDQMLNFAVEATKWDSGDCGECSSQSHCPFRQNAAWLRTKPHRKALLEILRKVELANGQRWNFRAAFSLIAELVVGERGDFLNLSSQDPQHPCDWVHELIEKVKSEQPERAFPAAVTLMERLYPYALMGSHQTDDGRSVYELSNSHRISTAVVVATRIDSPPVPTTTPIRYQIETVIAPAIDPAKWTPKNDHYLRQIEDGYAQSIAVGTEIWSSMAELSVVEKEVVNWIETAELECEGLQMSRDSKKADSAVRYFRIVAANLAKRSIGVRLGAIANDQYLTEYETTIRDRRRLFSLQGLLRQLLGGDRFTFGGLTGIGEALTGDESITLVADGLQVGQIATAPDPSPLQPAHDVPVVTIAGHNVPLTFDVFEALKLMGEGCVTASLPANVRASLERLRSLYAGQTCRNEERFLDGRNKFILRGVGEIVIPSSADYPRFQREGGQ